MLAALSIRDVVLIDRLDLAFGPGLTVLTGETGAGKSILLDSLGLALGARSESGLVRVGRDQASVAATFSVGADHPAQDLLREQAIEADDQIVLRRVVARDGRSRAFVNDSPIGAALLRRLGALLVEVQGQHEQMGLADAAGHTALLDSFAVAPRTRAAVAAAHGAWRAAADALAAARARLEAASRDEAFLRHAVAELADLAPVPDEEDALASRRQSLQQSARRAEAIVGALAELAPGAGGRELGRDRRAAAGPAAALRAASRAVQRIAPAGPDVAAVAAALDRAEEAVAEAELLLSRLAQAAEPEPGELERAEERLFALRAAARKHQVPASELPALRRALEERLAALETGTAGLADLQRATDTAWEGFAVAAAALTGERAAAARRLDAAIGRELAPLKLDRARFVTELVGLPEAAWSAAGAETARFLIATNPGQAPGPLARAASGGELSRLMLALKVVLAGASSVPTMVFDEIDSGIGGATAAAVGERLVRVAERVQVLLVTHSPQVAARGLAHLMVSKTTGAEGARTRVEPLEGSARREEIARMLAGQTVTDAARAAAESLLEHAG
jgi:DNA repair protein RecN (Recombination protein N)